MTETIDWAPYANDGEFHKCMVPKGIPLSLTTDDIEGARFAPTIKTFLHPEDGSKMLPDTWLPQDLYRKKRPSRRLITDRVVNPLNPQYKIPEGPNLLPAGDWIFSNRITDLLDVSDIVGAKPKLLYKGPVRVRLEDIAFDKRAHPAKWTRERLRCTVGTGLELFDINIGKKRFGFDRHPRSNPLEPLYPTDVEETAEIKFKRLKAKKIAPRKRFWQSGGEPAIDKVMEKLYWKSNQLSDACKHYDVGRTDRVSYEDLRTCLEQFGVKFTDEEYQRLIPFADKDGEGCVPFFRFSKGLRWPSGLQDIVTKRLGRDQWEGIYTNLGQGLQVLVDTPGRTGKKIMREAEEKYHLVNVVTGDPLLKEGCPLIPPREMLCLSYSEQLADEENTKRDMAFKSFMPADPPKIATMKFPVLKSATLDEPQQEPAAEQPALPPVVPPPAAEPPPVKKSVVATGSPRRPSLVVAPPETVQPPPSVPGVPNDMSKPLEELKLPVIARKSMAPPGGFDTMPTVETMKRQQKAKKLSHPSFPKRLRQERRNEEIQSVLYLV